MALVVRSRHTQVAVECNERGVLAIESERQWEIAGPADELAAAERAVAPFGKIHRGVLDLDFGNAVCVLRVPALGTLEVLSGKCTTEHFESMLADIARVASALPFRAATSAPLPYDRSIAARDDVLYHAFVYLRHIVGDEAPRDSALRAALRAILADPHRRWMSELTMTPIDSVHRVGPETVSAISRGVGPFVRAGAGRSLPRVLRGRLPQRVPQSTLRSTIDTPENRFVRAFLDQASGIIEGMRGLCTKQDRFSQRILADCDALSAALAPFTSHAMWKEVGEMRQIPGASTVLQRRRGYRDVFRHFVRLRMATRHLPLTAAQTRDLLEARDIATLYELWCYFRSVEELSTLLGAPESASAPRTSKLGVHVERPFEVRWKGGYVAMYNRTFSQKAKHRSYSLPLRPDIAIELPNGNVHVLDAKFRLVWEDVEDEDVERANVKLADVYKMHAYRDALERVESAWVLYPGTEKREFRAPAPGLAGVGAVPLRPEVNGGRELRRLLTEMLDSPAPPSLPHLSNGKE